MKISPFIFVGIILFTAFVASALTAFWLRRRFRAGVALRPCEHTPERGQLPTRSPQTVVDPGFRPVRLTFVTPEAGSPVLEVSALQASALPRNKRSLDPSRTKLSTFSSFLGSIPSTLTGAEFGRGNYMQVVVHGPGALASKPESFCPLVRGTNGRVEKLAGLRNNGPLQQAISDGAVWQFAFIIVAQRHLADIEKKLAYLSDGIGDIRKFLANERRSKIAGMFEYLRQVVDTLGRKESPAALGNQLEHIERELLQLQNHIVRDFESSAGKIDTITPGRFSRRKALAKNFNARADEILELEKEWLLCILARTVNWQVLSIFPGEKQFKITRREALYKSIEEFTQFLQRVYRQLDEKIASVKSAFDSLSMKQQDKSLLLQFDLKRRLSVEGGQISSDIAAVREDIKRFSNRLWSPQKPIVLALRVDKGRISDAYEIETV